MIQSRNTVHLNSFVTKNVKYCAKCHFQNKQKILLKKIFFVLKLFFFPVKLFLILKTATVSDITTDHDFPRTQST